MNNWVVDSSAILAVINGEAGSDRVEQALREGASMSSVNACEVGSRLYDQGMSEATIRAQMTRTRVAIIDFTEEDAYRAAALRLLTRHAGLSLGDRACLALAARLGATVLTADRVWAGLQVGVNIELLR